MGIYKVANKPGKTPQSLKALLKYAFGEDKKSQKSGIEKTHIENCLFLGEWTSDKPYSAESVFEEFQRTKRMWRKEKGRQYAHIIHSFHKDEKITEPKAVAVTAEIIAKCYPHHQAIIIPHHDKGRIDVHVIINSVSSVDGRKIHTSKKDIEKQKRICNDICRSHFLSVPQKGKDFYGREHDSDMVISWKKDTYQTLTKQPFPEEPKDTNVDMIKLLFLVVENLLRARSIADFIQRMRRSMWKVTWKESKKHITFESMETKRKFRSGNLDKTYGRQFRQLFGESFVLDKEHMTKLLSMEPDKREQFYGRAYQELKKSVDPVYIPEPAQPEKPSRSCNRGDDMDR